MYRTYVGVPLLLQGLVLGSVAHAEVTLSEVQRQFSKSTLSIGVRYETLVGQTPRKGCKRGSGFIISKKGHVVTSYHLFTDDGGKRFDRVTAIIAKIGEELDCDSPLGDVVSLDEFVSNPQLDTQLLKIRSPRTFSPVSACLGPDIADGSTLYVLGFPLGLPISSLPVTKSNETTTKWQITGKFDAGASGGPVFGTDGKLVGMVYGTFESTNISYVVPIDHFNDFFARAAVQPPLCKIETRPQPAARADLCVFLGKQDAIVTGKDEDAPFGMQLVRDLKNGLGVSGRRVTAATDVHLRADCPIGGKWPKASDPPLKAGQSFTLESVLSVDRLGTTFYYARVRRQDIR